MGRILQKLLKDRGAASMPRNTRSGKLWAELEGVEEGPELLRIRVLERRVWQDDDDLPELMQLMTARFRKPGSSAELLPMQALALAEAVAYGRCHTVASVGSGKTLLSLLLPIAFGKQRPLLLTYAALVTKTIREFQELSKDWQVPNNLKILSYEKLSLESHADYLDRVKPDIIISDESHALKAFGKAGRSKRLSKFLDANEHTCVFTPLTGTPGDSTINDYSHLLAWSCREHSPLPRGGSEQQQWAQALDEKTTSRRAVGALKQFSADGTDHLEAVREGIGQRIEQTPGVVYYRRSSVNCSLYLHSLIHDKPCPDMDAIFAHVRKTQDELPNGRVLETPIERYQLFQTLGLGFYRYLDPAPPVAWREARKSWHAFVNQFLDMDGCPFETPAQVTLAVENGTVDSLGTYEQWKAVEPSFTPVSKVEWFSDVTLNSVADYMAKHKALIWTSFPAFGRALAKRSGKPFYHHGGVALGHGPIEERKTFDSVVLSLKANAFGRNLQGWHNMLLTDVPAKADLLEQVIGRCHRQGQKSEAVNVTFLYSSAESCVALEKARGRARFDSKMNRNVSSKLLCCDFLASTLEEVRAKTTGARWRVR